MKKRIEEILADSIAVKQSILQDDFMLSKIEKASQLIIDTYRNGGKLLLCGNGGSAADALHLAGEFCGRFYLDRKPLFAEALNVNIPTMTAIANDYSFEDVYARILEAKAQKGDVLLAISTSGFSPNILKTIDKAKELDVKTIGFTGKCGGDMANKEIDVLVNVPSKNTPRIQEAHITIGHIICELVEKELFENEA
ncbi:MAG: D-sedoheptulose-7-phosphate isomerase [Chitinophagales bacterium]